MEQSTKLNGKFLFYIYVILFPILPSYTKLLGQPVYRLLSLFVLFALVILNFNNLKKIPAVIVVTFFVALLLKSFTCIYNNEYSRILYEIINVFFPLFIITFAFTCDNSLIEETITILIIISVFLCFFGLIEEFTKFNVFSLIKNYDFENQDLGPISSNRWGVYRIEQGFNTALTYAMFLTMCMGLVAYRYFSEKRVKCKVIYGLIFCLQLINEFFTVSRGITIILLLGIFLAVILNLKNVNIKYMITGICIAVPIILIVTLNNKTILEIVKKTLDSAISIIKNNDGFSDESMNLRNNYQQAAFDALKDFDTILWGVGETGLRKMFSIDNNWLLEITGYGIFGTISFLLIIGLPFFKALFEILKNKDTNSNEYTFFRTMLIALIVYYASLYTVAQMEEARLFYILFGIVMFFNKRNNTVDFDNVIYRMGEKNEISNRNS